MKTELPEPAVQPSALPPLPAPEGNGIQYDGGRWEADWVSTQSAYSEYQMFAYGQQCAEQERKRILQIVSDVIQAFGKPGECIFITVRARANQI